MFGEPSLCSAFIRPPVRLTFVLPARALVGTDGELKRSGLYRMAGPCGA